MTDRGVQVRSAGAVVFRERRGRREYLLIRSARGGHWDFAKGKREPGESLLATVRREAREETGLADLEIIPRFAKRLRWRFREGGKLVVKQAVYVLARTAGDRIRLSDEHRAARWVSLERAVAMVSFANARAMLRIADIFLGGSRPFAAPRPRGKRRA
jgi:8-oxo-dGTP pyrophosphatase MutT (NUDIX family)